MLAELYMECGSIFGKGNTTMTDKQIIIDGVDVSGCKSFYSKTKDCIQEDTVDIPCADYPNCHYKNWKRAEQKLVEKDKEIERLKQGIKHYQRGMFSIINTATECRNNKKWNYKE